MVACLPAVDTANQMTSSSGKAVLECDKCVHTISPAENIITGVFFFPFLARLLEEKLMLVITTTVFHTDVFSSYRKCSIASK